MKEIIIQGEPIAMQRPRLGRGHTYNPQAELKKTVQLEVRSQWGFLVMKGAVAIRIGFYLSRNNKDLDNMIKFYGDCLQGIVFKNDLQIVDLWGTKFLKTGHKKTVIWIYEGMF